MIQKSQKQDPVNAYIAKSANVQAMLKRLSDAAADHFDTNPDEIHWGHVGDVSHIEEKLKTLCDIVFKEGEHAPENKA